MSGYRGDARRRDSTNNWIIIGITVLASCILCAIWIYRPESQTPQQKSVLKPNSPTKRQSDDPLDELRSAPLRSAIKSAADSKRAAKQSSIRLALDDVNVSVVSAFVGKVRLTTSFRESGTEIDSEREYLQIELLIENRTSVNKINYRGQPRFRSRQLTDDIQNQYLPISFAVGLYVNGQYSNESIYPGKSLRDLFVFEVPVEGAKQLILNIPGDVFDPETPDRQLVISWQQ